MVCFLDKPIEVLQGIELKEQRGPTVKVQVLKHDAKIVQLSPPSATQRVEVP
jgi:hypothetical protein